jgi:DNA-binding response OmpR family regulator
MLPHKVLVVEDELITQRYIKNILREFQVNDVVCFNSADGVIDALEEVDYEMVLMDINIRGAIDGIALAKEILNHKQIPIIFITAYNDDETLDEVLEISPFGFLSKPFNSKDLITIVKIAYHRFLDCQKKKHSQNQTNVSISSQYSFTLIEKQLFYNDKMVDLNTKQKLLIELLVKNINNVVSFETLEFNIWQDEEVSRSSLRTLVYSIRKLLPNFPLKTYSKKGYYIQQI